MVSGKIFFSYFSTKHGADALQMSTHNICVCAKIKCQYFCGEIKKKCFIKSFGNMYCSFDRSMSSTWSNGGLYSWRGFTECLCRCTTSLQRKVSEHCYIKVESAGLTCEAV